MGQEYWNGAEAAHRRVMMKAAGIRTVISAKSHTSVYLTLIWPDHLDLHI